jgi:hypothetical protein
MLLARPIRPAGRAHRILPRRDRTRGTGGRRGVAAKLLRGDHIPEIEGIRRKAQPEAEQECP